MAWGFVPSRLLTNRRQPEGVFRWKTIRLPSGEQLACAAFARKVRPYAAVDKQTRQNRLTKILLRLGISVLSLAKFIDAGISRKHDKAPPPARLSYDYTRTPVILSQAPRRRWADDGRLPDANEAKAVPVI